MADQGAGRRPAAASKFAFRLWGRFTATRLPDGADVTPRSRKARALLACLLAERRPLPREQLAGLLWSERGQAQAQGSLRQTLLELKDFAPLLAADRRQVAIEEGCGLTDIEVMIEAAEAGDAVALVTGLSAGGRTLLEGLDGLDTAFDQWLRTIRASRAEALMAAAQACCRRALDGGRIEAAGSLSKILVEVDPLDESAARLAMSAMARAGKHDSVERIYVRLRNDLRDELGVAPSPETNALRAQLTAVPIPARLDPAAESPKPGAPPPDTATESASHPFAEPVPRRRRRGALVAALAALLAAAAITLGWWTLARRPPAGPVRVAVLPFRGLSPGDASLADGIWEDTRSALARNPNLLVLGRTSIQALSDRNADARSYRSSLGAEYLVEGSFRRDGAGFRVNVSLVRAADDVELWSSVFNGRLEAVLQFEDRVAAEIEGRIRGRLAPGGGRLPQNIATSPEVYALYSEARGRLWKRDGRGGARPLLHQALAIDPNYAPAWAELAIATQMAASAQDAFVDKYRAEAVGYARRAVALAPNLAQAHAALGFAETADGEVAIGALRRAVALDPSDAEAWNWLGNALYSRNRRTEALDAYSRAAEIEPLWLPAVGNRLRALQSLGRDAEIRRDLARIDASGDPTLPTFAHTTVEVEQGNLAQAGRLLLAMRARLLEGERIKVDFHIGQILMQLGYLDEAARIFAVDAWVPRAWRGEAPDPAALRKELTRPIDFWLDNEFPAVFCRNYARQGRDADLVAFYRAAFHSPDEMLQTVKTEPFLGTAPCLAAALRRTGDAVEAGRVIDRAEAIEQEFARNGPLTPVDRFRLAEIRSAEGRPREAIDLLRVAQDAGWFPDGTFVPRDLADEPAFAPLLGDAGFQRERARLLQRIARERAELGPVAL